MSTPYVSETGLHASDNEPHAPGTGLHASGTEPHAPEAGLHAPEAGLHVRTVTGPLACASVRGPVLAHEHLVLDLDLKGDGAAVLDADRHGASVGAELTALREEFGLSLVVELTCRGMGRDPRALARMSRETGVAVVAATGWYYEPFHPAELTHATVEQLTATLVAETGGGGHTGIEGTGMDGTGIRPGVIGEVGSHGEVPSEPEARSLRAAARAARTTGLSVATHAQLGRGGPAQLDVLTGEGLPPHRVSVGHQDLLDDPAVHRELAAAGAYVAFDTVGKDGYQSDETRLRLLLALLEAGHADRILLSCDISRHGYLRTEGGQGYGHLFRSFLPAARAVGVDDDLIDLMTRRNPLRFLTGASPEEI
ncbi:phosphotriesterase [Streptomyces sp. NBC_01775]|uniref:phosphotriesterase family protein n=1 Tax=Streptomyces sp. NBC_01775 TaxID=2975939 RepID=UPI002DDAC97A|nr:phosphotriesterase [Streptomyces sp. NBC_01775]WSB79060.1 phosphotriesterase [Streptomyces sp. NBC_01775]